MCGSNKEVGEAEWVANHNRKKDEYAIAHVRILIRLAYPVSSERFLEYLRVDDYTFNYMSKRQQTNRLY